MFLFLAGKVVGRGIGKSGLAFSALEIYFGLWMHKGIQRSGKNGGGKNNQHQVSFSIQISTIAADQW
jgi:hypothetical protein